MDLSAVVPLDVDELVATATRHEGVSDFGEDYWREPLAVLVKSLNEQAQLTLFGRLLTREWLLDALRSRLQIEAAYARSPEIDDEVVDAPVIVMGLPRSGTSILFELLSQDPNLGALLSWEVEFPCPPPEAATYDSDPRIERAEARATRTNRLAPVTKTMYEAGARTPAECIAAFMYSFMSESIVAQSHVPDYADYLATKADWVATYAYHRRLLKLLQWKNPRGHWLLKSPPHIWHLEPLFATFPDAGVVYAHRDPIRANASGASLIAALRGIRSDMPFDADTFAAILKPEATAAGLNHVIDQIESGRVPRRQIFDSHYAELMRDPMEALRGLYGKMGLPLSREAEERMRRYLEHKPQGKFGFHQYETGEDPRARAAYARYQQYFGVVNEA